MLKNKFGGGRSRGGGGGDLDVKLPRGKVLARFLSRRAIKPPVWYAVSYREVVDLEASQYLL